MPGFLHRFLRHHLSLPFSSYLLRSAVFCVCCVPAVLRMPRIGSSRVLSGFWITLPLPAPAVLRFTCLHAFLPAVLLVPVCLPPAHFNTAFPHLGCRLPACLFSACTAFRATCYLHLPAAPPGWILPPACLVHFCLVLLTSFLWILCTCLVHAPHLRFCGSAVSAALPFSLRLTVTFVLGSACIVISCCRSTLPRSGLGFVHLPGSAVCWILGSAAVRSPPLTLPFCLPTCACRHLHYRSAVLLPAATFPFTNTWILPATSAVRSGFTPFCIFCRGLLLRTAAATVSAVLPAAVSAAVFCVTCLIFYLPAAATVLPAACRLAFCLPAVPLPPPFKPCCYLAAAAPLPACRCYACRRACLVLVLCRFAPGLRRHLPPLLPLDSLVSAALPFWVDGSTCCLPAPAPFYRLPAGFLPFGCLPAAPAPFCCHAGYWFLRLRRPAAAHRYRRLHCLDTLPTAVSGITPPAADFTIPAACRADLTCLPFWITAFAPTCAALFSCHLPFCCRIRLVFCRYHLPACRYLPATCRFTAACWVCRWSGFCRYRCFTTATVSSRYCLHAWVSRFLLVHTAAIFCCRSLTRYLPACWFAFVLDFRSTGSAVLPYRIALLLPPPGWIVLGFMHPLLRILPPAPPFSATCLPAIGLRIHPYFLPAWVLQDAADFRYHHFTYYAYLSFYTTYADFCRGWIFPACRFLRSGCRLVCGTYLLPATCVPHAAPPRFLPRLPVHRCRRRRFRTTTAPPAFCAFWILLPPHTAACRPAPACTALPYLDSTACAPTYLPD